MKWQLAESYQLVGVNTRIKLFDTDLADVVAELGVRMFAQALFHRQIVI